VLPSDLLVSGKFLHHTTETSTPKLTLIRWFKPAMSNPTSLLSQKYVTVLTRAAHSDILTRAAY